VASSVRDFEEFLENIIISRLLHSVIKANGFPLTGFINNILIYFQETAGVGFISTAIFCFLSIYIIWAVTKGNVKFGIRIPFLFSIHPMK